MRVKGTLLGQGTKQQGAGGWGWSAGCGFWKNRSLPFNPCNTAQ